MVRTHRAAHTIFAHQGLPCPRSSLFADHVTN
jgi:hypothetical protein